MWHDCNVGEDNDVNENAGGGNTGDGAGDEACYATRNPKQKVKGRETLMKFISSKQPSKKRASSTLPLYSCSPRSCTCIPIGLPSSGLPKSEPCRSYRCVHLW